MVPGLIVRVGAAARAMPDEQKQQSTIDDSQRNMHPPIEAGCWQ